MEGDKFTILIMYVDDIILIGNGMVEMERLKRLLAQSLKLKFS